MTFLQLGHKGVIILMTFFSFCHEVFELPTEVRLIKTQLHDKLMAATFLSVTNGFLFLLVLHSLPRALPTSLAVSLPSGRLF